MVLYTANILHNKRIQQRKYTNKDIRHMPLLVHFCGMNYKISLSLYLSLSIYIYVYTYYYYYCY